MATDEGDSTPSPLDGEVQEPAEPTDDGPDAVVGSYTWDDFLREHGEPEAARTLYQRFDETPGSDRWGEKERTLTREDWDRTDVDPGEYLGFPPWEIEARIGAAGMVAQDITDYSELIGYDETPVIKDIYGWEDYKREYFYDENGDPPTDAEGEPEAFDAEAALGVPPESLDATMADCERAGEELQELIDERTVNVDGEVDEDAFFSDPQGRTTVANRYDLEKTVPLAKKHHFEERDRYWVNKPFSFVVIFHSTKENEIKYYVVQPHLTEIESELSEYLTDKLRASIKYEDEGGTAGDEDHRRSVIENKTRELLDRYDLYEEPNDDGEGDGLGNRVADTFGLDPESGVAGRVVDLLGYQEPVDGVRQLQGIEVRPEPVLLEEDADILNEYQVEKLLYYLERDFIGYERIDGIKHDINVEDISCDGYNSPVFVYHSDYEQIITNVYHGEDELDDFVVKLAQRSGKGISKRRPQVDATLPDGSRAQLTLGREVSDHGTNYTIRQFKDVPFTPVDLINWQTFSLGEMAFLWLCIENHKSLIFAGGTASGKTTSLNAVSLFIPSNTKIVSIEDTREVELPQRNWIASVTRPSFSDDDKGDVDEFDLLEAALRQRPDYIVMGEIRGEEGRTLFQVMSTGHTTYTTFHADNVGEVLKRFTTEPINVSKTMFTALDLVSVQTSTRVQGQKVRRNKSLTEINHYDAENDEINVQDVYQWQAETDEFLKMGDSNTLDEIMFDRGWDREKLDLEMFKRRTVLAYLIHEGLNTYTQVAATFQAFINDPETILSLMANDQLEASLEDLREMESVLIDIDPEKEEMVPRPEPNDEILAETEEILERAEEELFEQYYGETPDEVADALVDTQPQGNVEATPDAAGELPAGADEGVDVDDGPDRDAIDGGSDERNAIDEADDDPTPELEPGDDQLPDSDAAAAADDEAPAEGPSDRTEPDQAPDDTASQSVDDNGAGGTSDGEPSAEGHSAADRPVDGGPGDAAPADDGFEVHDSDDGVADQTPAGDRPDDERANGDVFGDRTPADEQFDGDGPIEDPFAAESPADSGSEPALDERPDDELATDTQSVDAPDPNEPSEDEPATDDPFDEEPAAEETFGNGSATDRFDDGESPGDRSDGEPLGWDDPGDDDPSQPPIQFGEESDDTDSADLESDEPAIQWEEDPSDERDDPSDLTFGSDDDEPLFESDDADDPDDLFLGVPEEDDDEDDDPSDGSDDGVDIDSWSLDEEGEE
ncbi:MULTISPECIES: ATPase, T2SS/T4P/T4SS family [Halolamina]|uniref:Flagellar protein FlaI n=1 Tax=Halolamina pelagica TaxID=699431 RepID=A0A1I5MZA0_9EURY|nr:MULTISPECIES: ATPase, T2SS/T4P/T4SS family [Halolamina]NHX36233.1 Flp pilus assembly complex ATPase component TadA [Halolamina sp. R1-12]SFP14883.1 flagellar protein FlaI [Halolamina pelagica]